METVTITKAEYDALIANQAHLEQQVKYLLDQMRLARHRQFGASSEKSEYDSAQLNLFNEAEVFASPEAEPVIRGSFASPEAVAHIVTQKFVMGIPRYRQEQEWKQQGILLSRQTMSNWLLRVAEDWLDPIYSRLREQLCRHEVLHADETTLPVLCELGKKAQSKSYTRRIAA